MEQQKLLCRTSPQLSLESWSSPDCPCYSLPMSPSPPYAESEVPKVPKMRAQCPTWSRGSKTCTWLFFRARSVWRGLPVKLEVSPRMQESASLLPRLQHLSSQEVQQDDEQVQPRQGLLQEVQQDDEQV